MNNDPQNIRLLHIYLALAILEGIGSMVAILSIPADPKNAWLVGYSPERIFLIVSLLFIVASFIWLLMQFRINPKVILGYIDTWLTNSCIISFLFMISVLFLIVIFYSFNLPDSLLLYRDYTPRLMPALFFGSAIGIQTFLLIIFLYISKRQGRVKQHVFIPSILSSILDIIGFIKKVIEILANNKNAPWFIFMISILKIISIFNQRVENSLYPDVKTYRLIAENMTHIYDTSFREPLWIWFVKISQFIFGNTDLTPRFLGIILFLVTAFLLYRLILDIFQDQIFAIVGLMLFAWNSYLISLAIEGLRDVLFLLAIVGTTYFAFANDTWISEKIRFIGLCGFIVLTVGTRITSIYPLTLIAGYTFLKYKFRFSYILLTFFVLMLFIGPHLYYNYINSGDPFFSANVHAVWWRNYEFLVLKGTGCEGCPSLAEFQINSYSGEPTTMFQYIFGLHPLKELFFRCIQGFRILYLTPSPFFVTLAGIPHPTISDLSTGFIDIINFRRIIEITFFVFYLIGLIVFLFRRERLILLIPLLLTNFSLFIVYAMPLRIYSANAPFILLLIACGMVFTMRSINYAGVYVRNVLTRSGWIAR